MFQTASRGGGRSLLIACRLLAKYLKCIVNYVCGNLLKYYKTFNMSFDIGEKGISYIEGVHLAVSDLLMFPVTS